MRLNRNCGLSFKVSSGITCLLEIILSGLVGALCVMSWIKEGHPMKYIYTSNSKDDYLLRNRSLEECVILWCLSIIMAMGIGRIISSVILFCCVKRNSTAMAQYWIMYKILVLMMSIFVGISSLTVPTIKYCAIASLAIDVITCYFIVILYPQIERMGKTIRKEPKADLIQDE